MLFLFYYLKNLINICLEDLCFEYYELGFSFLLVCRLGILFSLPPSDHHLSSNIHSLEPLQHLHSSLYTTSWYLYNCLMVDSITG